MTTHNDRKKSSEGLMQDTYTIQVNNPILPFEDSSLQKVIEHIIDQKTQHLEERISNLEEVLDTRYGDILEIDLQLQDLKIKVKHLQEKLNANDNVENTPQNRL